MKIIYPCGLNKGFTLKFPVSYPQQQTPDEGLRTQQLECDNNNKQKTNSSTPLNNNNNDDVEQKSYKRLIENEAIKV